VNVLEEGFEINMLREKEKFERIYAAGEKGLELEKEQMENGVKLAKYIVEELESINKQHDIGYKF
jgi:LDH2 family malate/lactate/ureidoglycolate dehydrogenase